MARGKKASSLAGAVGIAVLVVIGWIVKQLGEIGWSNVATVAIVGIGIAVGWKVLRQRARRAALLEKYGDAAIVDRIVRKVIWQGETAPQLTDSLGTPPAVDDQILKTKRKQIWKYQPDGRKRYRLRVTLEDDLVVGWDNKG